MIIPEEYIIQKFYQYAGFPIYNKFTNVYNGCCPVCREGKSWGRKKRLFFLPKDNVICCHNCGWYGNPVKWICAVSNCEFRDIANEVRSGTYGHKLIEDYFNDAKTTIPKTIQTDLPDDSINLFDNVQIEFYKHNKHIQKGLQIINDRKLSNAINKPKTLWMSLKDKIHQNRIIIPFYLDNKIVHYQTRSIYSNQTPKYLSKQSSDKSLFNIDNINSSINTLFITEGPIDSFFIENGIAVAGIQEHSKNLYTKKQRAQMNKFMLHEKIWVLDSQWLDKTSCTKTGILCEMDEKVFIWPKNIGTVYKDVNDMCVGCNINRLPHKFIKENTFTGIKGKVKLSEIN
jgi:hypothetical protein